MSEFPSITELESVPMLVVALTFLSISWLAVSLRIYVRGYMIRAFGWDDWLMIATQLLFTLTCVMICAASVTEITQLDTDDIGSRLVVIMVMIFGLYIITTVVLKLSLAVFFLRVVTERWQRYVIYTSVTLYTTAGMAWFFIVLFQCGNPVHTVENAALGKCLSFEHITGPLNYAHGALNAITDWSFAIVPIFVVRSSQMSPKARASVIGILALGAAGSLASLVRLGYVNVLGVGSDQIFIKAPEYAIVSIIELGLGITAASLATLRPLCRGIIDKASSAIISARSRRKIKDLKCSDEGIIKRRSVDIGFEQNLEMRVVSGQIDSIGRTSDSETFCPESPTGKGFTVSIHSGTPRVSELFVFPTKSDFARQTQSGRSHSPSPSDRSLLSLEKV